MVLQLFNPRNFRQRTYRGIICFLLLVALAMILIAPIAMLLPAVFMAGMSLVIGALEYETGYLAVVLSVCKKE